MASGSQNMTTYNARTVTGSSSAASPAGALLLSGAGRASDATGDTWIFLDSLGGTSAPWGIKHDQANNKIHIYGNNTNSAWVRMDTGDTYILGKVGIGYDPETSGNTYKLYVNGNAYIGGSLNTGSTLTVRAQNNTREGGEIILSPATSSFSTTHIDAYDSLFRLHDGTNERFKVNISNGNTTINGNLGIGSDYAVSGGSYKLYVNGSSYFVNTITGDATSAWHILGGRPADTTNFNTYFENVDNLHHDNPARTDVELTYNRFFLSNSDQTNYGPSALHLPVVDQHVLSFGIDNGATYSRHMAFDIRTNAVYVRARTNNTWGNWEELVRNTGTWGISITGNAATATTATTWAGLTSRWNHNTSDTWIPVRSNNNIDYVLKTEIANSATAFVKKSGDTMTSTLTLSGGSINVRQGSVWAGTNGNTSGERQVGCQSGAGTLYMYSQAATNANRGIYGANHAGTSTSYLYIQQDNYVRAGTRLYGAVWNDYAEFRLGQMNGLKPGQIVTENGDGTMCLASKRLQKGCKVLSDTYGFALGETNEYKLPIAVSGRVLVYCDTPIEELEPGDCLCSNVTGNAVKMTREEIINYPDCIIGTVSEIPTYNIWHCGDQTNENGMKEEVWVNGRIWIYVR